MSFLNYQKILNWLDRTSSDSNSSDDINTIKDAILELGGNGTSVPDKTIQENATAVLALQNNPSLPSNYITGLEISNGTDTDHEIDIAIGRCKDSTGAIDLILTGGLTVDIEESGAGGLDTGSVAADTWYYIYLIYNSTTTTYSGLLSTSATSPTMPSGYDYKRRIRGAVLTDGSSNILGFRQKDDNFRFNAYISDLANLNTISGSRQTTTVSVPPNFMGCFIYGVFSTTSGSHVMQEITDTDVAPAFGTTADLQTGTNIANPTMRKEMKVNSSSQVAYRTTITNCDTYIVTEGFIDPAQD